MKIIKVKIQKMEREEFFEFLKQVAAIIVKYDATKLKVVNADKALTDSFADLQAALDKENGSLITKTINDLDHKRDVLISAFIKWLEAMVDFPDSAIAADAAVLLHYVNGFGTAIAKQTNLAETTILTNIVDGFTKDTTRSTALAAMNGTQWITAIDTVNKDFSAAYANRVSDVADTKKVKSFSEYRKTSTELYSSLVALVGSRYNSAKEDAADTSLWETCIADLNQLITQVNTSVELSKPKPKPKEEGKQG